LNGGEKVQREQFASGADDETAVGRQHDGGVARRWWQGKQPVEGKDQQEPADHAEYAPYPLPLFHLNLRLCPPLPVLTAAQGVPALLQGIGADEHGRIGVGVAQGIEQGFGCIVLALVRKVVGPAEQLLAPGFGGRTIGFPYHVAPAIGAEIKEISHPQHHAEKHD
jgi:hypothetical protein